MSQTQYAWRAIGSFAVTLAMGVTLVLLPQHDAVQTTQHAPAAEVPILR